MEIRLSDMSAADLSVVAEIERLSTPSPWPEEAFRAELVNAAARCRVARADGATVGFLVGWHLPGESQVAEFAVHPDLRRNGAGGALLDDFLIEARRRGAAEATLEVRAGNLPAQDLYASRGFRETSRRPRYYEETEDAVLMSKNISDDIP